MLGATEPLVQTGADVLLLAADEVLVLAGADRNEDDVKGTVDVTYESMALSFLRATLALCFSQKRETSKQFFPLSLCQQFYYNDHSMLHRVCWRFSWSKKIHTK